MEEKVKEMAECCICTDLFTDPRMLPCIHTFCLKCLHGASHKSRLKPGDSMPCPICRRQFVIPRQGVAGLQRNFFMERLVEVTRISKPSEQLVFCQICYEVREDDDDDDIPAATQYCVECQEHICNGCGKQHKVIKSLKDHQLVPLGSPIKQDLIKKFAIQKCSRHSNEQVKLFCFNCKEMICMMCFVEEHSSHKCSDVEKVGESFRQEIANEIKQLEKLAKETSDKIHEIETGKKQILEKCLNVETSIIERSKQLKELIDKSTKSLLDELSSVKQQFVKQLETEKEETERHLASVESLERFSEEFVARGAAVEMCRQTADLLRRSSDLKSVHSSQIQQQVPLYKVSFVTSAVEKFLPAENFIGTIKASVSSTVQLGICSRLQVAPAIVCGVTKIENKCYVLCRSPYYIYATVFVFQDQNPFYHLQKFQKKEIEYPFDIASSTKSRCLFISDKRSRCIWKMTIDHHRLTKWKCCRDPFTLSVNSADHVLILGKDQSSSQLSIFGSEGNHIRNLLLPGVIQEPLACIQVRTGEFIISHKDGETKQWTVSRVSSDGQKIVRQFHPRITTEELSSPWALCLDSMNDRLFISDSDNRRVLVFDSESLELQQILLTNKELEQLKPFDLIYDSRENLLIVKCSHKSLSEVKLFQLK